ncbi:MAG: autotransporter outer membrane beta-barrel domain-containing protein, partial [Rhodobacteraceae bacterium]|nr:autotransporter outer membrane beta-barrel domain-containing protein [Paracoccaceae bacterium]
PVTVAGSVTNAGSLDVLAGNTLTVGGTTTNTAGGTLTVAATATLAGDVVNTGAGATLTLDGTIDGDVSNTAGALLQVTGGAGVITGALANAATVEVAAGQSLAVGGLTTNAAGGSILIQPGALFSGNIANLSGATVGLFGGSYSGTLGNNAGATFDVSGISSLSGSVLNAGTMNLAAGSVLSGAGSVINTGTLNMADGALLGLALTSSGLLTADGTVTLAGPVTQTGGIFSMQDGATDDILNITGGATLNGTIAVDVDLSDGSTAVDRINLSGTISGSLTVAFDVLGTPGTPGSPFVVIDYGPATLSGFSVTATGLPAGGSIAYLLVNNPTARTYEIIAGANPAIGGLASGITLTQSLIGSVINRPSSPFVAGLAVPDDKPCGVGAWGRAIGGTARASGDVVTTLSSYSNDISANFYGIQLGGDFSCFEGFYNGWDLSFGGILGTNFGNTELTAFALNPLSGELIPEIPTDVLTTDFAQVYGGMYLAASRGRFFADLQYRLAQTSFDLSSTVINPALSLGIVEQTFESRSRTLSGSFSYAFPLGRPEDGIALVPTAGFSYTSVSTDRIDFPDGAYLQIRDFTNEVLFAGATLSRTIVRPDGQTALTYFGTATVYKDFADPVESVYFTDAAAPGESSFSSNLDTYGEISLGLNYTRLLDPGQAANARQLNASVRLDGRFSDTLESWGITAQVRLQF